MLNPIAFSEGLLRTFLQYQRSAYPFSSPVLNRQLHELLDLDKHRHTPLHKGPYVSLSQPFREGAKITDFVSRGIFHPHLRKIIPKQIERLYGHQQTAVESIHEGHPTVVSTGTGSGKTETFMYPIISRCLFLRDEDASPGITAVIVYPMNALAEDQLDRLRGLLAGTEITFGMYVGKTPENESEVQGKRLPKGSTAADYQFVLNELRDKGEPITVHPYEELCSRQALREKKPRILLTNIKQLELLLTRQVDAELFDDSRLEFLVFDEAHTFSGQIGAETACLIRRLKQFAAADKEPVCIATSATITNKLNIERKTPERFAHRLFGVPKESVAVVREEHDEDNWSNNLFEPLRCDDVSSLLPQILATIGLQENVNTEQLFSLYETLIGQTLPKRADRLTQLHTSLLSNKLARLIHQELRKEPKLLEELPPILSEQLGRAVSVEEVLSYLALGSAAVYEGRPVFRPVVHVFIRGIQGGTVSFPADNEPKLSLYAAEDKEDDFWRADIYTCTTCGQHYFVSFLKDFHFNDKVPEGGDIAEDGSQFWTKVEEKNNGCRTVLLDTLISEDDEEEESVQHHNVHPLYFCRYCGSAHKIEHGRCCSCGKASKMVLLYAVKTGKDHAGYLGSCLSCKSKGKSRGRSFREPCRPVRAVTVSDVHVLAQDIIHRAERERLLIFADNRQDAAFQAGWMKDHSRRFRLRAMIADAVHEKANRSIGDAVYALEKQFDEDEGLSRALMPEVWRFCPKEGSGEGHFAERRYYLRIQILRELATATNQRFGLEPWGRLKISYAGLTEELPFVQKWSVKLGFTPSALLTGIEALLDYYRRNRFLYDNDTRIFSKYIMDGDREVQRGYMPSPKAPPKGLKLESSPGDDKRYHTAWLSQRNNVIKNITKKWGVKADEQEEFLLELWQCLTDDAVRIFKPVTLRGSKDKPLPGISGVYQIDASCLMLHEHSGFYRCRQCQRKSVRPSLNGKCLAWQCSGDLIHIEEENDNYDLQLLDERYQMLRPEEHTAMVPQPQRERYENFFKGKSNIVNVLVCSPTLELGVDIGALDAILLRNVPPLPSNYWQRVGRAGRRQRMAFNLTYCRPASHDRAYFDEPLKMLTGQVEPPVFNLHNELLIRKHIHAAVLTRLQQLGRNDESVRNIIDDQFPKKIAHYLFADGTIRSGLFDITPLRKLIGQYENELFDYVRSVFQRSWTTEDAEMVSDEQLRSAIQMMSGELEKVLKRLFRRLRWYYSELERLKGKSNRDGTLDKEDEQLRARYERRIKKLKGQQSGKFRNSDRVDDTTSYGVLATEGFLPGYGLDVGMVTAYAEIPRWFGGNVADFTLPRASTVAVREYVPGNLIYANGTKFTARLFHLGANAESNEVPTFIVNTEHGAIQELPPNETAPMGSDTLLAVAACDVDLTDPASISDDDDFRFQMSVAIFGKELGQHNGGAFYRWGNRSLTFRSGVSFRLVNTGTPETMRTGQLGYPLCRVCGQAVSPLSSDMNIDNFKKKHSQWCGKPIEWCGFYSDITADCLTLPMCSDKTEAYSVLEALRMGAGEILDMNPDDLQVLVIGNLENDYLDAVLWDPMPGGSGLLEQMIERWAEVLKAAEHLLNHCSCEHSCIDCMQTFHNAFYHSSLDRKLAVAKFGEWGNELEMEHAIEPLQPKKNETNLTCQPVNDVENTLKHLLKKHGFLDGKFQYQIHFKQKITLKIGSTTPDVFFEFENDDAGKGVCIYLDGLSQDIHGNSAAEERDRAIRNWLPNECYDVLSIACSELSDENVMTRYFRRLNRLLGNH